jgi:hypothetical protein
MLHVTNLMCMSCGCGEPEEDHDEPANLVLSDFVDAASAAGISLDEVIENILKTYIEDVKS